MKTKVKKITALLLMFVLALSMFSSLAVAAGSAKSTYFGTVSTAAAVNSGVLDISNYYTISGAGFTSAEIHTYVERKTLGLFWVKVDNGQPDKTWVDTSTAKYHVNDYSLTLSQTGTYRVTAEYTFYGTSGSESITKHQTVTY